MFILLIKKRPNMQNRKKLLFLMLSIFSLNSGISVAHGGESKPPTNKLKLVMQGLLKDSHLLSEGIFYDDFAKIEKAAKNIADHPNPGMPTMKKVIDYLGKEMPKFKGLDGKVHNTAVEIAKAAKNKNMVNVISGYHELIDGCQSCHSQFKMKVSRVLNGK